MPDRKCAGRGGGETGGENRTFYETDAGILRFHAGNSEEMAARMCPFFLHCRKNGFSIWFRRGGIERILCDPPSKEALPEELRKIALIPGRGEPKEFSGVPVSPEDLINVLFTSGSTGRPKGVMIRHRSIANLLSNMKEALECVTRPMICATTPVFDIFITEQPSSSGSWKDDYTG